MFRHGTPIWLREFLYFLFAGVIRLSLRGPLSSDRNVDEEKSEELKERGLVALAKIDSEKIKKIEIEISNVNPSVVFNQIGQEAKLVYSSSSLTTCPTLLDIAFDPQIYALAERYLNCPPIIQYLSAWETNSADLANPEMYFHLDHHGHKFLKLFVYLTDVREGDGHHEYVACSHNWKRFRESETFKSSANFSIQVRTKRRHKGNFWMNNDVVSLACASQIEKLSGPAGTIFLEDTSGLHRGTKILHERSRLIFQVLYTPFDSGKDAVDESIDRSILEEIAENSALPEQLVYRLGSKIFGS